MRNKTSKLVNEELAALAAMPDDQIDLSDAPELSDEAWEGAIHGKFYRPLKQQLTIRIDADIVDWLKKQGGGGRGYQSRLNQILRSVMIDSLKGRQVPRA